MYQGITVAAIVPAAGTGTRMGSARPKQFIEIGGKPILLLTLEALHRSGVIDTLIVAAAGEWRGLVEELLGRTLFHNFRVVAGGTERQNSVRNGLDSLSGGDGDLVIVHDAVRPFIGNDVILPVLEAATRHGAAVPGVLPRETLKTVNRDGFASSTLTRTEVRVIQTPQAFKLALLKEAHRRAHLEGILGTDDASLVERTGGMVKIVEGSYENIKITAPEDIAVAELIAGKR